MAEGLRRYFASCREASMLKVALVGCGKIADAARRADQRVADARSSRL